MSGISLVPVISPIGQMHVMGSRLNDVIHIIYMNTNININDDRDMMGLFSAMVTGLVPKEFVKHLFLTRCVDGGDLLEVEGCPIASRKVNELKELARRMGLKGLSGLRKAELVNVLLPYEESLTYFPAEAIAGVRRYLEHLKNKKKVEKIVGKAVANSLSWLNDANRPFYRYGALDCDFSL